MVSVTAQAASEIRAAQSQKGIRGFGLRVQIVGGGCEGFLYDLLFVDGPEPHQKRHVLRLWLKFPTPWPLSAEFPTHMGYKPAQDTPILIEADA